MLRDYSSVGGAGADSSWSYSDWVALLLLLVATCLVRLVFYTGALGSDEVVYTQQALAILNGEWATSGYIGALRYGINLPVAAMMALFGVNEFSANLWSLLCSLGEVIVVFVLARNLWGGREAVLACLVLALLPLHVHFAGRMMADAPLAFFISLSFLLFWKAEKSQGVSWYLATGIAVGSVYWVKESVTIFSVVFALYAIIYRHWNSKWLWVIGGALAMVTLNSLLMLVVHGDPFHIFHVAANSVSQVREVDLKRRELSYYFYYLFLDPRHTWLLGYLALAGVVGWVIHGRRQGFLSQETVYVMIWGAGLLLLFSFFFIPTSPIKFITKQVNYMLIFVAPLALLAGYGLARLSRMWLQLALVVMVIGSLVLAALEQQTIRVFTANSKAAVAFVQEHPGVPAYGSQNASNMSLFMPMLMGQPVAPTIQPISKFVDMSREKRDEAAYVLLDSETITWGGRKAHFSPETVPSCWQYEGVREPQGFGIGQVVLGVLRKTAVVLLPETWGRKALAATEKLMWPSPMHVYLVPGKCVF